MSLIVIFIDTLCLNLHNKQDSHHSVMRRGMQESSSDSSQEPSSPIKQYLFEKSIHQDYLKHPKIVERKKKSKFKVRKKSNKNKKKKIHK